MSGLFDLAGSKAIVTGGCAGLGLAIAEGLADAGAEVALLDRLEDSAAIAERLSVGGRHFIGVRADLMDRDDLGKGFDSAVERLGSLTILVNNAGIQVRGAAETIPLDQWDRLVELNITAVFEMSQLAARLMLPARYGKIINVASMLSFFGGLNCSPYAASKGAVAQLTKAFSNEWAGDGINVNAIAPGYMDTALNTTLRANKARDAEITQRIPAHRWGVPDDLKGTAVFLASHASDYVSGAIIPIDGGYLAR